MSNPVTLVIDENIVNPIVKTKIQEAILAAMGGGDKLIENVVNEILNKKVDQTGKVSTYSSENKFNFIDVAVRQTIVKHAEEAIRETLAAGSEQIKEALIKQLQTKKGANLAAEALLDGLNGSFKQSWTSKIDIQLTPKSSS